MLGGGAIAGRLLGLLGLLGLETAGRDCWGCVLGLLGWFTRVIRERVRRRGAKLDLGRMQLITHTSQYPY